MKVEGWNVLDEGAGVLWREYAFTKGGSATTFVFRGVDGLVVISPATGVPARELDAIAELGEVSALVANNTFHHLGQKPWRERFPNAVSYAPKGATAILEKKTGIAFKPLEELTLPSHVRMEDPPGFKSGEVMGSVTTDKGAIWFTADLLTNIQNPGAPLKWVLPWFDSGPGFRLFRPGVWLFIKDKRAVREWALTRLVEAPPIAVVPGHGPLVEGEDVAAQAKKQVERL